MPTPLIPDMAVFQRKLATLPLVTYQAGETVLSAASTTGRLLILKEGAVAVVKEGVEIARVTEPGAVFGELSVLLDQPHTADVRALEASQFHVADAATILRVDPIAHDVLVLLHQWRADEVIEQANPCTSFVAVHESVTGTFRTCQPRRPMSGFRGKAALPQRSRDGRV